MVTEPLQSFQHPRTFFTVQQLLNNIACNVNIAFHMLLNLTYFSLRHAFCTLYFIAECLFIDWAIRIFDILFVKYPCEIKSNFGIIASMLLQLIHVNTLQQPLPVTYTWWTVVCEHFTAASCSWVNYFRVVNIQCLWNLGVFYHINQILPLGPILNWMNKLHTLYSVSLWCILKLYMQPYVYICIYIYIYIYLMIHTPSPMSSFRFRDWKFVCIFYLSHVCHVLHSHTFPIWQL
jgi:hypothetical protein